MLLTMKKLFTSAAAIVLILFNTFAYSQTNTTSPEMSPEKAAFYTGSYPNLFTELLGRTPSEVEAKINSAFDQLFYGDDESQRVYYPVGKDMAYIKDINNNDVRTEGMSYGMMIAVQMDKKEEFNRLWKWTKTYMQHSEGQRDGYFSWHCNTDGSVIDSNSAADGEAWFVTALLLASGRWGDGSGILNYNAEAQYILDAMLSKTDSSDSPHVVTNMFNKREYLIVFVPVGHADDFTDPSYQVPHFYELWARLDNDNNQFWADGVKASRSLLKKAAHPKTGLSPDYSHFDGTPFEGWNNGAENFRFDAWRVAMNVAMDHVWFAPGEWHIRECNKLLKFFYDQGIENYGNQFTLDGEPLSATDQDHSTGLVAMNAVAALASTHDYRKEFVKQLWEIPVPEGHYRYYDGMLYMLGLLQVSGNFRVYK